MKATTNQNEWQKIIDLLSEYKNNDYNDYELRKKLLKIDKKYLFLALYFTDIDCDYYKKQFNKIRNDKYRN
jgi:hypothetical protein